MPETIIGQVAARLRDAAGIDMPLPEFTGRLQRAIRHSKTAPVFIGTRISDDPRRYEPEAGIRVMRINGRVTYSRPSADQGQWGTQWEHLYHHAQ